MIEFEKIKQKIYDNACEFLNFNRNPHRNTVQALYLLELLNDLTDLKELYKKKKRKKIKKEVIER